MKSEELSEIRKAIDNTKAKRILLQVPEGLKAKVQEISKEIENLGAEVIILADPCYGACDVPENQASMLNCDLIIHLGHSDFGAESKIPVVYLPWKSEVDIIPILKKMDIPYKRIGLVTTIQHLDKLEETGKYIESLGKEVVVGGQILGCRLENAKRIEKDVDAILYIGSGKFHPLGILKVVNKPVLHANIENGKLEELDKSKIEKIRIIKREKLKEAKRVGILVSTKKGQFNKDTAKIREKLEKHGKEVWILAMDYISPEKILGMEFDVLINTACPRIEDDLVFSTTIINSSD